jgi:hypothetical protein
MTMALVPHRDYRVTSDITAAAREFLVIGAV